MCKCNKRVVVNTLIMAEPEPLYHGFLGADGARFPGQSTVDIHFRDLTEPGAKIRLRSICLATSLNFIFVEVSNAPGGPWVADEGWLGALSVLNYGPVQPLPQVSCFYPLVEF